MARFKDLGPWRVVQEQDEVASPTRRTRRGTPSTDSHPSLSRDSDGASITVGDTIFITSDISSELDLSESSPKLASASASDPGFTGVITKLTLGLSCRVELWVLPMIPANSLKISPVQKSETEKEPDLPQSNVVVDSASHSGSENQVEVKSELGCDSDSSSELLLISKTVRVDISKIVHKVEVQSKSQSNFTPYCCRAADPSLDRVSAPFDFSEWVDFLKSDNTRAVFSIAEKTSIIISPRKRAVSETPRKRSVPKKTISYAESSESESFSESTSEVESESESEVVTTPRKKRATKKSDSKFADESPRKRNRDSARGTEVFQQVVNVLSPINKGFKIKSSNSFSSLPSLSRENSGLSSMPDGSASEAFRELKEKLHTSTRMAQLPCREEQFDELYMNLESAIMEKMGTCFYISGTPGVGKTATIREVIAALRDNVQSGYVDEFDFLEINSLKLLSPNSAYEKLWDHLTGIKVTPSNASLLLEEYFSRGKDIKRPLIILMDELDQLVTKNQKVIYNFFNWPTYSHSKLIVLAVANTMDLPERVFSNKIASRLGLRRMAFRGYTEEELGTIIEHRLKMLSENNKRIVEITPDAMRFASKKVAIVSGDARRALIICRRAVEMAERQYLETENTTEIPEEKQRYSVRTEHIGMAIAETVNSPTIRFLQTLPFASKLLLVGVLLRIRRSGSGDNSLGDIMDEMKNTLSLETKVSPLLEGLPEDATVMSLVYGEGQSHVRIHHLNYIVNELVDQGILTQQNVRSERHRLIALNISEDEVGGVLKKDPEVGHML